MKLINKVLNTVSSGTRKLSAHRKIIQFYKHVNKLFLALGANTIQTAKMHDETQILVDISTRTERIAFYTGKYDDDLINIIRPLIVSNTSFLDIGANIGFYSVAIGQYIKSNQLKNKVISFEPFQGNFKRLLKNLKINQLEEVCIPLNYGLSNTSGESTITLREDFKHGSDTGNAAIPTHEDMDKGFKTSSIKLKSLDDIWQNDFNDFPKIDVIKMDIEGHEDFCLLGGLKTINHHRPTILMEVNKPYYKARNVELDDTFMKLFPENYNIYCNIQSNWLQIDSLEKCKTIDNVFLVPIEKLELENYQIFKANN